MALEFPVGGSGTVIARSILDNDQLALLQEEINDPDRVVWYDNHESFENARGMVVEQNHWVFALKLHIGDPEPVRNVPRMRAVASNIESLLQGDDATAIFPNLRQWRAEEMSYHCYDMPETVGLGFHKDNLQFFGAIAVLAVDGEKDFWSVGPDNIVTSLTVRPGDLVLNRAGGLYPTRYRTNKAGRTARVNECPDHAVMNVIPPATSLIVRADTAPERPIDGFRFHNWSPPDQPAESYGAA